MKLLRSEILQNRQKWIAYLKSPTTKKAYKRLVDPMDHEARCCLGHACHILIPESFKPSNCTFMECVTYPSAHVINLLGLWNSSGGNPENSPFFVNLEVPNVIDLASLNDHTSYTPQQVGEYLESVIEGGPTTPFRSLNDYPET